LACASSQQQHSDDPVVSRDCSQQIFQSDPRLGVIHYEEYWACSNGADCSEDSRLLTIPDQLTSPIKASQLRDELQSQPGLADSTWAGH
jgi:hypothetical protein